MPEHNYVIVYHQLWRQGNISREERYPGKSIFCYACTKQVRVCKESTLITDGWAYQRKCSTVNNDGRRKPPPRILRKNPATSWCLSSCTRNLNQLLESGHAASTISTANMGNLSNYRITTFLMPLTMCNRNYKKGCIGPVLKPDCFLQSWSRTPTKFLSTVLFPYPNQIAFQFSLSSFSNDG